MSNVERAFIAYTVLKTQLEKADLFEGLMVFFRPITASLAGGLFIPGEFAKELGLRYGLHVPVLVLESLAERMMSAGLLLKRSATQNAASYEYAASEMVATNVSLPKITELMDGFRAFARKQAAECRELDDASLDNALFDRLIRIESLEILSRRDGLEAPKRTANTLTLKQKNEAATGNRKSPIETHLDYMVPRFILGLLESDSTGFNLLCDIASANLAAETLLTYRDPPRRGDALDEFDIYLDAPLCLDILGINLGREEYGRQLLLELKRAGCRVNIFLHSIGEIERILDVRKQGYYSATKPFDYFQVDPLRTQDLVKALAGHAEATLTEQLGFNVIDSVAAIPSGRRASVDAADEKAIRDKLHGWKNVEGREVDILTCCDLIRMRSGMEIQIQTLKAGATLVTRNAVLAKVANETWKNWLYDKNKGARDRIKNAAPLAIMDRHLAGLLWITQGGEVGALGRAHLVANCAAAIATRRDVITRVYNTLLQTSEQSVPIFAALINDQRAERVLMDATFGDPDIITDETVLPLLEKIRLSTAHEVESAKNLEIAKLFSQLQQNEDKHGETVAQLALERDSEEARRVSAENYAMLIEQKERQRKGLLVIKAFRHARYVYMTFIMAVSLALGLFAYFIQKGLAIDVSQLRLSTPMKNIAEWLIPACIASMSSIVLTWDMPELIAGSFRNRISDQAFRYFASIEGVDDLIEQYTWDFKTKSIQEKSSILSA